MENNNDGLDMNLFGEGNKLELDFGDYGDDVVQDVDPPLPTGEDLDEDINPSDGSEGSQEIVAEDGADDEGGDDSGDVSSPSIYHDLAAVLKEQGLLSDTEKTKIDSVDDLVSAFREEIKKSEYADLSDTQKEYLDAIRSGIPQEKYVEHKQEELALNNITSESIEEDAELRRRIILQDLVNQGLADDLAVKFTERSINDGADVEDAIAAIERIKAFNKAKYEESLKEAKAAKLAEQKKIEKKNEDLKNAIMSPDIVFGSYKPTEGTKEAVFKEMNTVVAQGQDGTPYNKLMKYRADNPIEFDAKLYYLFHLTNGFQDLKRFEKSGTSSAVSNLEKRLRSGSGFSPSGGQPSYFDNQSYSSGFGDELVLDDE